MGALAQTPITVLSKRPRGAWKGRDGITWDGSPIWYCDYTTLQLRAIEVPGIVTN